MVDYVTVDPTPKAVNPRTLLKHRLELNALEQLGALPESTLATLLASPDDTISRAQFKTVLAESSLGAFADDDELVDSFFGAFDVDASQSLDRKELLISLNLLLRDRSTDAKLEFTFKLFDVDGDGSITRAEIRKMLTKVSQINGSDDAAIDPFIASTFERFDANGDDQLSFEEFQTACSEDAAVKAMFSLDALVPGGDAADSA